MVRRSGSEVKASDEDDAIGGPRRSARQISGMLLDSQLDRGGAAEGSRNRIDDDGISASGGVGAQGRADSSTAVPATVVVVVVARRR